MPNNVRSALNTITGFLPLSQGSLIWAPKEKQPMTIKEALRSVGQRLVPVYRERMCLKQIA
jgi:hypothetical protein